VDPSELLANIEAQIIKAKDEALSRKEVTDRIDKWLSACEEENWLDEYNQVREKVYFIICLLYLPKLFYFHWKFHMLTFFVGGLLNTPCIFCYKREILVWISQKHLSRLHCKRAMTDGLKRKLVKPKFRKVKQYLDYNVFVSM